MRLSVSQIKTWQRCPIQHFYKYHLRLTDKTTDGLFHLILGLMVHEAIEACRASAEVDNVGEKEIMLSFAERVIDDYAEQELEKGHTKHEIEICRHVAKHIIKTAIDLPVETFDDELVLRSIQPEKSFDIDITANVRLVGYIDELLEVEGTGQRVVREIKTQKSIPTDLAKLVSEDLQTHVYSLVENAEYVLYTVFRKPPTKYLSTALYDDIDEQKEAIDGYYERARVPYRQELVPIDVERKELFSFLVNTAEDIRRFYEDPIRNILSYRKPNGKRSWPCVMCDFAEICHDNKPVEEAGFAYKRQRQISDNKPSS